MAKVEFHFDFGSPNAYLAHLVIPRIEQRTGAKFEYVPVLLGGVFKLTNNRSPRESLQGIKNKPAYQRLETQRFLRRHGITRFQANPFFPVNTLAIMRGAVAAQLEGVFARYVDEFDSPYIRAYFDVGNVAINGYPQDWIRTLGPRIVKLHIKDFRFRNRVAEFVALREGDIDWRAVHRALADVPTWKEMNVDAVAPNWRGVYVIVELSPAVVRKTRTSSIQNR